MPQRLDAVYPNKNQALMERLSLSRPHDGGEREKRIKRSVSLATLEAWNQAQMQTLSGAAVQEGSSPIYFDVIKTN